MATATQNALEKTNTPATPVTAASAMEPTTEPRILEGRIRERAYQIYLARYGQNGSDIDDWLQAEQQILLQEDILSAI